MINNIGRITNNAYIEYIKKMQSAEPMQPEIQAFEASALYVGQIIVDIQEYKPAPISDAVKPIPKDSACIYNKRGNIVWKQMREPKEQDHKIREQVKRIDYFA